MKFSNKLPNDYSKTTDVLASLRAGSRLDFYEPDATRERRSHKK